MTDKEPPEITPDAFSEELHALESGNITLIMPVGALTRRLAITSIKFHGTSVELSTASGEVLTFPASQAAEIRRSHDVQGGRSFVRYEVTFPLGDYFALIAETI